MKPEASRASSAGCGAFRLKTASWSPLAVTLSTLAYQPLRKLTLKFSCALPASRSKVHFTSAAVNGLPSCHVTPSRSAKVSFLPSSLQVHLVGEVGHDAVEAVLRLVRVEHDEVVEHPHHRHHDGDRAFLVDRHAGGAVAVGDAQDAALLLCPGGGRTERQTLRVS